jgi:Tfp pilus assembly protein PilF
MDTTNLYGDSMKSSIKILVLIILASCASPQKGEKSPELKKAELYYNQGTKQMVDGNFTKALRNLLKAIDLSPEDSRINNNLGMAFYFKGASKRAVKYIKKSLLINPKNSDAKINLATIYMSMKKYKEAEQLYEVVLDDLTYEGQHKTYFNLGMLNLKINQETKAISYFKQSLNVADSYCPSHFQLGNIYFKRKNFKKALNSYREAGLGVCYEKPEPIYKQALSMIKLKKYESAKLKLEEIVERFAMTKYERKAQQELKLIAQLREKKIDNQLEFLNTDRKIVSPDF